MFPFEGKKEHAVILLRRDGCKDLVEGRKINCWFHNCGIFVLGQVCEWPLFASASHTQLRGG